MLFRSIISKTDESATVGIGNVENFNEEIIHNTIDDSSDHDEEAAAARKTAMLLANNRQNTLDGLHVNLAVGLGVMVIIAVVLLIIFCCQLRKKKTFKRQLRSLRRQAQHTSNFTSFGTRQHTSQNFTSAPPCYLETQMSQGRKNAVASAPRMNSH